MTQEKATGAAPEQGPRQLVLCFDGTNNNVTGGRNDTNVAKLCRLLLAERSRQVVYYDPGVGNPGSIPGVTWDDKLRGTIERLWGLAFGKGVYENIAEAYVFLMRTWCKGDRIFVYGFSRGAFTARSLAGMVARFGILRPSMESMVPTLLHLYFADSSKDPDHYDVIRQQISECFCDNDGAKAEIWFTGVWDTVDSVGAPFSRSKITAAPTIIGKRMRHVRHALALDEHRRSFTPRLYYIHPTFDYAAAGQSIEQFWWRGAHCDVGGGYTGNQAELSDKCFAWMLQESVGKALLLKPGLVDAQGHVQLPPAPPRQAVVHSEVFNEAYWALTGLQVRRFDNVLGNPADKRKGTPADPPPAPQQEHPSVEQTPMRFPQDTNWSREHIPWGRLAIALVGAVLFWFAHDATLTGQSPFEGMRHCLDLAQLWANLRQMGAANWELASWQLNWWRGWQLPCHSTPAIAHPFWMLLADLGLILSYGYLVARGLARGFAKVARLRRLEQPHSAWLNLLGLVGTVIVSADVAEDLLVLATLGACAMDWTCLTVGFGVLMTAASAIKWLAAIPAALLIVRGLLPARKA